MRLYQYLRWVVVLAFCDAVALLAVGIYLLITEMLDGPAAVAGGTAIAVAFGAGLRAGGWVYRLRPSHPLRRLFET